MGQLKLGRICYWQAHVGPFLAATPTYGEGSKSAMCGERGMEGMTTLRRIGPALALLIIAPLIAEFLLGDFNIRQIGFLGVFIPVYGAGALLVREITRRARRGWPTMLLLALAYA